MCKLFHFPGLYGILVGLCLFFGTWWFSWRGIKGNDVSFDPQGAEGAFDPLLSKYLDIAKFVLGLASGSIVLLVGSATFHDAGRLLVSFANPLYLLALSIICGVVFMVFMMLDYEAYLHKTKRYTRRKYSRNLALGFTCLSCFCVGYVWLIVVVTKHP